MKPSKSSFPSLSSSLASPSTPASNSMNWLPRRRAFFRLRWGCGSSSSSCWSSTPTSRRSRRGCGGHTRRSGSSSSDDSMTRRVGGDGGGLFVPLGPAGYERHVNQVYSCINYNLTCSLCRHSRRW